MPLWFWIVCAAALFTASGAWVLVLAAGALLLAAFLAPLAWLEQRWQRRKARQRLEARRRGLS